MANNNPAFVFNSNTIDSSQVPNPNQSPIIGTVSDSGGAFTNAQMVALFPNPNKGAQAIGTGRMYEFNGTNWFYYTITLCA